MLKARPVKTDAFWYVITYVNRRQSAEYVDNNDFAQYDEFVKVTECALVTKMIDIILATHSSGNIMDIW